jgi:inosine-uridine nucleoside N-ribohydrolase
LTNLALLEILRPGRLAGTRVVAMGGWFELPPLGWPRWGPDVDFNIQADARAGEILLGSEADITFVPLATAMQPQPRTVDIDALRRAGPVGELLARQSPAHAHDAGMAALAATHENLADDLVNFHWDPVAAAVAAGWSGATITPRSVRPATDTTGALRLVDADEGRPVDVATAIDAASFASEWLHAIERGGVRGSGGGS